MIKIRLISFFLVSILFANLSYASFAMKYEEDTYDELNKSSIISMKELEETSLTKKEKSCSHWGLSRWFYGIPEYLARCICCDVGNDYERKYIFKQKYNNSESIVDTSDCCIRIEDPIWRTLCCPAVTAVHLCCLPFACCDYSKNITTIYQSTDGPSHYSYPTYNLEEEKRKEQEVREREKYHQNWRMGEWRSGDLDRQLKAGWHQHNNPN